MELSEEQLAVVQAARDTDEPLFITGGAGTGKSVALRAVLSVLRPLHHDHRPGKEKKKGGGGQALFVTASTGLAALDHEGGRTLHSFAGLTPGDEERSAETVVARLRKSAKPYHKRALARWRAARTLVIEEVSMVSAELFDLLDGMARLLRRNQTADPFGGIRLIMAGDFLQLGPVPNERQRKARERGRYAFESDAWKRLRPVVFNLKVAHRQAADFAFYTMLSEIRSGALSEQSKQMLQSRVRHLFPPTATRTSIYPLNRDVNHTNATALSKRPGVLRSYEAVDYVATPEDERLLKDLRAPKLLELKPDAQVMLLRNMTVPASDTDDHKKEIVLTNGMMGRVVALHADAILVAFPGASCGGGMPLRIEPVVWEFRDKSKGDDHGTINTPDEEPDGELLASRTQFPLMLAYAMSGHKSQGQTLTCAVETDLASCFETGQAYVILSRVKRLAQISILKLDLSKIQASPVAVDFYKNIN